MPIILTPTTSASTANYALLRADIEEWLHRTDLDDFLPEFVRLAESDIRNDVRVRAMETTVSGTVSSLAITHPTDMIEPRRLVIDGYVYQYTDPVDFAELERLESTDYWFTSIGQSFKVLTGTSYTLVYWAAFDELVADADTNWLLQNALDVYLWACLKHAAVWAHDVENTMKFDAMYQGSVKRINEREKLAQRIAGPNLLRTSFCEELPASILTGA